MYLKNNYLILILFGFLLMTAKPIMAENSSLLDTLDCDGRLIDSIVIENRNIYDVSDKRYDKFLFKAANKIHQTTQKNIIARELLFDTGEEFSQELAEETARILRQRFVLYDAWIEKELYANGKLLVRVVTIDRWSLSGGVDVRREGNENQIKIGLLEKNLLGRNRLVSYHYINRSDEGSYSDASTEDKRIFGKKLEGRFALSTNPLGKFTQFMLQKPYYDLNQQFGFRLLVSNNKGRVDYYSNDTLISQSFYKGNRAESDLFYRFGSYREKVQLQLKYIYNYETNESDSLSSTAILDTMYHAVKVSVGYTTYEYHKKYNIDGFNYTEDYNGGVLLSVAYQLVYSISAFDKLYNLVSMRMSKNLITQNSLLTLQYVYVHWGHDSQKLRSLTALNLKYYNQAIDGITFASNLDYRADKSSLSFDLVNLGGTTGLRGIDKFFLTGDKRLVLNTEIRLAPIVSFLSFNIGMAVFTDIGSIIHEGEDFMLSESIASVGAGFRIAFDRSSRNVIRLDFAHTQNNGWQLSFGTGQYFRAQDQL